MKIPSKVKVGAVTYKVVIDDNWPGSGYDDGETCWKKPRGNVIYLNSELTDEAKDIVFIHEGLHAMNSSMSHEFLDSLAQQIYAFFKENDLLK